MNSPLNPHTAHGLIKEIVDELGKTVKGKDGRDIFLKKCNIVLKLKESPSPRLDLPEAKKWASIFKERI